MLQNGAAAAAAAQSLQSRPTLCNRKHLNLSPATVQPHRIIQKNAETSGETAAHG